MFEEFELNKFKETQQTQLELIESLTERNKILAKENKELKDRAYKDKTLAKLNKKYNDLLEDSRRGFSIDKDEWEKLTNWETEHIKEKHWDKIHNRPKSFGAIGGNFSYEFLPTSIGTIGTVKCTCGDCFTFQDM